jgi:hypothetical protein
MADSGYKNISRIDNPRKRTHGWYVRIQFNGQSHAKFFSDINYGSSEEALQAALEHRNELEAQMGKPRTERYVIGRLHQHNNTGVPGVIRMYKRERKRGRGYIREVFEVTWNPEPNRVSRTSVSISKYGEAEAFRRACAIRAAKMAQFYQPPPEPLNPSAESVSRPVRDSASYPVGDNASYPVEDSLP